MRSWLAKLDPLIVLIILAVIIAIIAPASGSFAVWFGYATKVAIAVLFFLYGARLSTAQALDGVKHWRLHATIVAFTFVVFPVIGIALRPIGMQLNPELYLGILYLTLVPSTVQSSVAFTSIAKGNVAGAIVSASLSNVLGVVLTPVLVMLTMNAALLGGDGVQIDTQVFIDIAVQLLLPFVLGQLCRPWFSAFAARSATKVVDRGSIAMVVYAAFSAGVVSGVWQKVGPIEIISLVLFSIALVAAMLWFSRWVAHKLGFTEADVKAIQFCGSKKSLATGLPMAAVIFGGANIGILIVPLMIFHQVQLMMCSWLASRYARSVG
ncbi:MAG: bile acid:sodium symporter family protein [Corynebacterium sp.]|uniref:bile acid:sodium symporter family protein n=1 Tax=Corynebacterium sp. TaxID=1720 RepID=UPI0026DACFFA|nr:bile acid:sodium symporter family protein [Corynebacterium sp.]MDO5098577.1 bile acid:sodium symporter family protein [Corynebacterium sp.]